MDGWMDGRTDGQTDSIFYQDKSAGDTSCYYHILSQDAFVIIQIYPVV